MPLKKGQIIKVEGEGIFEVTEDVEWNNDFNCWGSVCVLNSMGLPIYFFTHKGGITIIN